MSSFIEADILEVLKRIEQQLMSMDKALIDKLYEGEK